MKKRGSMSVPCHKDDSFVIWGAYYARKRFMAYYLLIFALQVREYLSITESDNISWAMIKAALSSVARTAIVPMQDILGLGSTARMNTPATQVSALPLKQKLD